MFKLKFNWCILIISQLFKCVRPELSSNTISCRAMSLDQSCISYVTYRKESLAVIFDFVTVPGVLCFFVFHIIILHFYIYDAYLFIKVDHLTDVDIDLFDMTIKVYFYFLFLAFLIIYHSRRRLFQKRIACIYVFIAIYIV